MIHTDNSKEWNVGGISVWAMAMGCIVGWGAFIIPGTTLIPNAGPLGSVVGTLLCALFIFVICINYRTLALRFPGEGGSSYMYTKSIIGGDHAFLAIWSLILAYLSVLWANSSAMTLLFKYIFGDGLQKVFLYKIGGYDVYLGEVLFASAVETVFGFFVCLGRRLVIRILTVLSILLFLSVAALFIGIAVCSGAQTGDWFSPAFSDGDIPKNLQIIAVTVLAPWLFVGFESVTHIVDKIRISVKMSFRWVSFAVFCAMAVYVMLQLVSVSGTPEGYASWKEYFPDLKNISGSGGMPVLFNAEKFMGKTGVFLVVTGVLSALLTSIIGYYKAASKLLKIMSDDGIFPERFGRVNQHEIPQNSVFLIMVVSVPVMFLGHTAVGWVVDIATLCVALVYAYISGCAFRATTFRDNKKEKICALLGIIFSDAVFMFLIIPNVISESLLAWEAYLILSIWSLVGIVYYYYVFKNDKARKFGKSTVMCLVMVFILFFSTIMWNGFSLKSGLETVYGKHEIHSLVMRDSLTLLAVVVIALLCLFSFFTIMLKREHEATTKLSESEEMRKEAISENVLLADFNSVLVTQKAEVENEKKIIEKQKNEMQSSINYAYTIQNALLPPMEIINQVFPDNFLIYKPKSVVSGDFYWIKQFGDNKVCVIADCTGHGVPGGFMSMLGITNLNYIVGGELSPDMILNKLRRTIISDLRQNEKDGSSCEQAERSRNGIDAAVYVVNEKNMTLSYAGANNPLIMIREGEVSVLKADKMPVGFFVREVPFTRHEVKIQKGDCFYTFSDGYQDQLNYKTRKKFQSNNLRSKLLEIHALPMKEQKEILVRTFEDWRGPKEKQVDDVIIFGVRI
jgi:amino acid transporter